MKKSLLPRSRRSVEDRRGTSVSIARRDAWLFWLLVANVITSIVHFVDNVAFFSLYPEPTWNSAGATDRFWFIMTPIAFAGYWLRDRSRLAMPLLLGYAAMGLLVLGHYVYAPFCSVAARIHATVLPEAIAAAALLLFVVHRLRGQATRVPAPNLR